MEWKTRPHVTLAVYNDIDADRCAQLLEKLADEHRASPAILDSVGMFNDTKTIFLSPTITRGLYDLHSELHALMKEFEASAWKWYKSDGWVPHCTVALTSEDAENVFYEVSDLVFCMSSKSSKAYAPPSAW